MPTTDDTAILVDRITVDYNGVVALHDTTLRVPRGVVCALVGMNGAGKSTLFKASMGFHPPSGGRVLIEGQPVKAAQRRGRLGFPGQRAGCRDDGPLRLHEHPADAARSIRRRSRRAGRASG